MEPLDKEQDYCPYITSNHTVSSNNNDIACYKKPKSNKARTS